MPVTNLGFNDEDVYTVENAWCKFKMNMRRPEGRETQACVSLMFRFKPSYTRFAFSQMQFGNPGVATTPHGLHIASLLIPITLSARQ